MQRGGGRTGLPPARLSPFRPFVLGGVPGRERLIGDRDRDDATLWNPVVGQVDDVPLSVVLVFDDQRDRSHGGDCN